MQLVDALDVVGDRDRAGDHRDVPRGRAAHLLGGVGLDDTVLLLGLERRVGAGEVDLARDELLDARAGPGRVVVDGGAGALLAEARRLPPRRRSSAPRNPRRSGCRRSSRPQPRNRWRRSSRRIRCCRRNRSPQGRSSRPGRGPPPGRDAESSLCVPLGGQGHGDGQRCPTRVKVWMPGDAAARPG